MASLPLTPSHSPQGSLHSDSSQPRDFNNTDHRIRRLDGHCAELADLMGGDDSGLDNDSTEKQDTNSGQAEHPPYRHGQIGVYKPFPRFDQASRPIVSDNWRAAASFAGKPQTQTQTSDGNKSSMATPIPTSTSTFQQDHPRSTATALFSPTRSPLTAPIDQSTAGFGFHSLALTNLKAPQATSGPISGTQVSPDPTSPPTPVSLTASVSTPISGRAAFGLESGHVHHTSSSSVGTAASSGYQVQTQTQTQTQPTTHTNTQPVTVTVTITPDTLGYCFVRPDGTRTRLVPVDMLPFALEGMPKREGESQRERLVELPVPGGVGEDERSSNWQVLSAVTPPSASSGDVIQSRIDRILAAPSSPPSSTHRRTTLTITQNTPPTTISTVPPSTIATPSPPSTSNFTPSSKRMKVYCDKWVHEGVCAFTQQGCKYKHEMPADRATQHQLGLFLGYPAWWKRRQGELARVQTQTQTTQGQTQQIRPGQGQIQGGQGQGQSQGQNLGRGLGLGLTNSNTSSQALGLGMPMGMGMGMGGTQTRAQIQGYGQDGRGWRMLPPGRTQTQPQGPRLLTGPGDDLDTSEPRDFRSGPTSHGLTASRWGGGGGGNMGNTPVNLPPAREKILPAAWRSQVPSSSSSSSSASGGKSAATVATKTAVGSSASPGGYDGPTIQSYDGASDIIQHRQLQHDELSRYHLSSSGECGVKPSLLLGEANSSRIANAPHVHQLGNNTSSSGLSSNDTRMWAWEDQRQQQKQQQQPPYRSHGQTLSGSGSAFAAACSFSFRPTTTTTANTSPTHPTHAKSFSNTTTAPQACTPPSPSPFGPIAPPISTATSSPSTGRPIAHSAARPTTHPTTMEDTADLSQSSLAQSGFGSFNPSSY